MTAGARAALLVAATTLTSCAEREVNGPTGASAPGERHGPSIGAGPPGPGPIRKEPDLSRMARIAGGTFRMGHPTRAGGGYGHPYKENEFPEHEVTLPEYYIDRDEVTVGAYAEFLTATAGEAHRHPLQPITRAAGGRLVAAGGASELPITFVSYYDAATYCAWAGKRLPTEAEWERAARGAAGSTYPWGAAAPTCAHAVFFTSTTFCERSVQPVGSRSPRGDSPEGVRDLIGNVAEWVRDVYDRYPTAAVTDPSGPAKGRYRVVRGGGLRDAPNEVRATARWGANPAGKSEGVGIRCAVRR